MGLRTGLVRAFWFLWGPGITIRRIPNGLRTLPEWEKETREETRADLSWNDCCSALGTEVMTHLNAEVNDRLQEVM